MLFTDKIFGQIKITEPIVLELIETPQMQRLKKIHQYGVFYLYYPEANTLRFEHSIGVYWLLKHFGASLEEQLSGLLHDISHGVFSHIMDHLYGNFENEEYQDSIHHQFFENNEISKILEGHDFNPIDIADLEKWPLVDSALPNLCADRLQYTLADSITIGKINLKEAEKFLNDLLVEDNRFVFQNKNIAKRFAELSLWMCTNFWHSNWGCYTAFLFKEIIERALKRFILTEADLLTNDELVIKKLENCEDEKIIALISKLKNFKRDKVVEDRNSLDYLKEVTKMRVIDPLVKVDNQLKRVTELFADFKEGYEKEKKRVTNPRYLKYLG